MARSVLCHVIVKLADEQAQRAIAPSDKSRVALFVLFPVTETVSNNEKKNKFHSRTSCCLRHRIVLRTSCVFVASSSV